MFEEKQILFPGDFNNIIWLAKFYLVHVVGNY
jgi:hypothetical protein